MESVFWNCGSSVQGSCSNCRELFLLLVSKTSWLCSPPPLLSLALSLFFFSLYGAHSVQFWFTSQQFLLSALSFLDREPCPGRKLVSATFHHTELSLCPRPLLGQWPVSRRFMVLCVCFSLLSFAQMLTPCCPRGDGSLSSHACILRFVSKKSNHRALL